MTTTILRIRRHEHQADPSHLLLHIDHIGPRKLDLKLICTDHAHLYHAALKESSIKELQASNFTGDLDQWKATLAYALLHRKPNGPLPEFLSGVELVAKINGQSTVTVTVRRNIGGITQNLGSLNLEQDDEREEVDVFEWVDVAAATTDDLRLQVDQSLALSSSQQEKISRLTAELDQLVNAKREHEDELLSKFAALLNAKKLKIRDQQRLLSHANVNPEAVEDVRSARRSTVKASGKKGGSKSGAPRGSKRKASAGSTHVSEDQDTTDDGGSDRRQQETPSNSGVDATDDEDEDDGGFAPAPAASQSSARALRSQTTGKTSQSQAADAMDIDDGAAIPPRRELPFGNKKAARKELTTPPQSTRNEPEEQVDEDDETDDEL